MGGGEHRPGGRNDRACGYIFPPEHYVLQRFYGSIELYGLFAAVGQLLHQNAVRTLRQGGSGHDAGSAACGQCRSRGIARIKLHHHRQGDRGLPACSGGIRAVQGVAVQRAAVKRGLVHPGAEVTGGNAPAGVFQRDDLRGRRRQKRCRVQHAAQRLNGGAERLVHYNFLHRPAALPFCYGSDGAPAGVFFFQKRQVKKKRRRLDRKIKTPPQNIPTKPAAAVCSLLRRWQPLAMRRPCSGSTQPKSTCEDGRSSFFQIAAFLLREGGGVSPATLECPPLRVQHCGAVSCSLWEFRHLCSKKLLYPDSIVGWFNRRTRPRR